MPSFPPIICMKCSSFTFNLIFAGLGVALMVTSILVEDFYVMQKTFASTFISPLPYFLIIAGAITYIVSLLGCCGTVRDSHWMLATYSTIVLMAVFVEILFGVTVYLFRIEWKSSIISYWDGSLKQYKIDKDVAHAWDVIQKELECCGVNATADWEEDIPLSCCKRLRKSFKCSSDSAYKKGCLSKVLKLANDYSNWLVGLTIFFGCCQLTGVLLACCIARGIRRSYETV